MPATGLKKVGTGATKGWKSKFKVQVQNFEKIQLGEVNWHQVCKMISYKRDVLEMQSLSEVRMGRGSPICERVVPGIKFEMSSFCA